ncbi:hypothetical protein BD324DRAFT_196210 [Kockovaella imperatae]|uniref:Zn(2)-C6 fungal-type domain-containing protein n=1 Tax=Kockovaella imperatae TaxID=4999 RepID=A0A1Y1U9F6_9TREE|nr:hypothetical protein BD324DRAFT_196210 [Kockovaella imperatae]ORX33725.1 hypothetical protein BD324DRAFT_196210 [Kockovaella imperatae]
MLFSQYFASMLDAPRDKKQRSRTGCLTCRRRRVKCDELPGICIKCLTVGVECEWATTPPTTINHHQHHGAGRSGSDGISFAAGGPFHGLVKLPACDTCRLAKTRCDRDYPSCQRCKLEKLQCVYSHWRKRRNRGHSASTVAAGAAVVLFPAPPSFDDIGNQRSPVSAGPSQINSREHSHPSTATSPSILGDRLSSRSELEKYLDAFFRHVHPEMTTSFIHQGRLFEELEETWSSPSLYSGSSRGISSPLLLKCMAAASGRFLPDADNSHPDGGNLPAQWAQEAKMALTLDMDRFSISKLAATLCLVHHEYSSGRIESAWTWTAVASRMCIGLGPHNICRPDISISQGGVDEYESDWIQNESKKRLVWATVCADAWTACGPAECSTFDRHLIKDLPLPSTEREFAFGRDVPCKFPRPTLSTKTLERGQLRGTSANHVWLTLLGNDVQWHLKHIADDPRPWEPDSNFNELRLRLEHWHESCASDMRFDVSTMYARKDDPDFGSWILVQLRAEQIGFLLRRFTMPSYEDILPPGYLDHAPSEWVAQVRKECEMHARNLARKISIVTRRFPQFVPANWTWNMFIYGSIREQPAVTALRSKMSSQVCANPAEGTIQVRPEMGTPPRPSGALAGLSCASGDDAMVEEGFYAMIFLLYKMTAWFDQNHRVARDLLKMLADQGIHLEAGWTQRLRSDAPGQSAPGEHGTDVLSHLPYLRRYIREPSVGESHTSAVGAKDMCLGPYHSQHVCGDRENAKRSKIAVSSRSAVRVVCYR